MELKEYQQDVIRDLDAFLDRVAEEGSVKAGFNRHVADKWGEYDPLSGKGMRPYRDNVPGAAHVCIKVPTAGGKTFIACNALHTIFRRVPNEAPKLVMWLVPWSNLLDQTIDTLRNPEHPYRRKLNSLFGNRVEIFTKEDVLMGNGFTPDTVHGQLNIVVMSFASIRARKKEDRKMHQENGNLDAFVSLYDDRSTLNEELPENSLTNVVRSLNPVIVLDESHNAETDLSVEMLKDLKPQFILDLTATPKDNSNIVSVVPAIRLKQEHMVKLPVLVHNQRTQAEVIQNALYLRDRLEEYAKDEEANGGPYIRPIVLFQAQPKTKDDSTTFEKVKAKLTECGIPEEQIKIKTANKNELKGVNLNSRDCPVRFIITINALKEGWDCPFAYVLATLADKSSAVDVEQILGRILRQPYVKRHSHYQLNTSYVLTSSAKFTETLDNIVTALQGSGYSGNDYRQADHMPEAEKKAELEKEVTQELFGHEPEEETESDDFGVIGYTYGETPKENVVAHITSHAAEAAEEMEVDVERKKHLSKEEQAELDMNVKVNSRQMVEEYAAMAAEIVLPQFYIKQTGGGGLLPDEDIPLEQENLLREFNLNKQDRNIDFSVSGSDIYKVDLKKTQGEQYTPEVSKTSEKLRQAIIKIISAKPRDGQISDLTHQLTGLIGDHRPVSEQEMRRYVNSILEDFDGDSLQDVMTRPYHYAGQIRKKVKELMDNHAEREFHKLLEAREVTVNPIWRLPKYITPPGTGRAISKSLYSQEASMNEFETLAILELSALDNVVFWHKNLSRGKGFRINGFSKDHYPDFIIVTNSKRVILLETKGDHLDNPDTAMKLRLGKAWANVCGGEYSYFMLYQNKAREGTYSLSELKGIVGRL